MDENQDSTARRPAPRPASPEEQHTEVERETGVAGSGPFTKNMVTGALLWTAAGAVVGAVVGALLALIPMGDIAFLTRLWIFAVAGAFAGSTAGFVWGGSRRPELKEDVGNQVAPAPLVEENRDPQEAREQVESTRQARSERAGRERQASSSPPRRTA
jgi:hypothetical protein